MVLDSYGKVIFLPSRQGCRTEDEEEKLHREKGKRKNIIEKLMGKKRPHGHFLSVMTFLIFSLAEGWLRSGCTY